MTGEKIKLIKLIFNINNNLNLNFPIVKFHIFNYFHFQLLGIRDIYVRTEGTTNNYIALCQAFITGLINQETFQQCADRTRLNVVELNPNRLFYPRVVAKPLNVPVKRDDEVELKEVGNNL